MEKVNEAYIDSQVFIKSILGTDTDAEKARAIISAIESKQTGGHTSILTFDEVAFSVRKIAGFEKSIIAGQYFLKIPNLTFIEATYGIIKLAQELIEKYRIRPRDAIHAACSVHKGIKIIVSDDADFDSLKELERKSIKDFKI